MAAMAAALGGFGVLGMAFHVPFFSQLTNFASARAPEIVSALNWASLESMLLAAAGIMLVILLGPSVDQVGPARAARGLGALAGCTLSLAGAGWFIELGRARGILTAASPADALLSSGLAASASSPAPAFLLAAAAQAALFLLAARLSWRQEERPPAPGARYAMPLLTFAVAVGMATAVICARGHAVAANDLHGRPLHEWRSSDMSPHLEGMLRFGLIAAVAQVALGALMAIASTSMVLAPLSAARRRASSPSKSADETASSAEAQPSTAAPESAAAETPPSDAAQARSSNGVALHSERPAVPAPPPGGEQSPSAQP